MSKPTANLVLTEEPVEAIDEFLTQIFMVTKDSVGALSLSPEV